MKYLKNIKVNMSDVLFVLAFAFIAMVFSSKISILTVEGNSMFPTLDNKDKVLLLKDKKIERGDIVVFTPPEDWNEEGLYIKRIIGKAGDTIVLKEDTIMVNGDYIGYQKFTEENFLSACAGRELELNLKEGEYFVMGDNFGASNDSFYHYCVGNSSVTIDEKLILQTGEVLLKFGGK